MNTQGEVESFLKQLREKIEVFSVAFRPRDKNLNAMADVDILPIDRIEYLKKLTVENYYSGPNMDNYDPTKPVYYEFGVYVKGVEFYIKISLGLPNKMVDCMSFHKAERQINYPLKK